jgi:two-component sensor histidine kinase
VISALIEMPTLDGSESVSASDVARMAQHVRSLGLIHDLLTHNAKVSEGEDLLSAHEIIDRLLPILQAMAPGRRIAWDAGDINLPLGQSTSLTMLVNELVSNAMKHGHGEISLRLTGDEKSAVLEVMDHGPGFPQGFDPRTAANTGLELIESLARWDLQGSTEYGNLPEGGARVTVRFPIRIDGPLRPDVADPNVP